MFTNSPWQALFSQDAKDVAGELPELAPAPCSCKVLLPHGAGPRRWETATSGSGLLVRETAETHRPRPNAGNKPERASKWRNQAPCTSNDTTRVARAVRVPSASTSFSCAGVTNAALPTGQPPFPSHRKLIASPRGVASSSEAMSSPWRPMGWPMSRSLDMVEFISTYGRALACDGRPRLQVCMDVPVLVHQSTEGRGTQ